VCEREKKMEKNYYDFFDFYNAAAPRSLKSKQ